MEDVTPERWLPVADWEGLYEVSDQGRVRSLDRMVACSDSRRIYRGRILKPCPNAPGGHLHLTLCAAGYQERPYIHQLVAAAFLGPCPPGEEVCHNDGNPQNNRLENLRYDTRPGNMGDTLRHGTRPIGSKHGRSILTEPDVIAIRAAVQDGAEYKDLAVRYGVSRAAISVIVTGRTWRHVPVLQREPEPCACCGAQFEPRRKGQIYCTRKCKEKSRSPRKRVNGRLMTVR